VTDEIEAFAAKARGYCLWVESSKHDLDSARRWLLELLLGVSCLNVGESEDEEEDEDGPRYPHKSTEERAQISSGLADLPFQKYRLVFSPCELNKEDPVITTLEDSLKDIYCDLWHGLQAWDAGDKSYAVGYWFFFYRVHWGHHASSAIFAVDEYYRNVTLEK
jgi:hypothetical protein